MFNPICKKYYFTCKHYKNYWDIFHSFLYYGFEICISHIYRTFQTDHISTVEQPHGASGSHGARQDRPRKWDLRSRHLTWHCPWVFSNSGVNEEKGNLVFILLELLIRQKEFYHIILHQTAGPWNSILSHFMMIVYQDLFGKIPYLLDKGK